MGVVKMYSWCQHRLTRAVSYGVRRADYQLTIFPFFN